MDTNFSFDPPLPQFEELSKSFDLIAAAARFSADTETPLSAYAKLSDQKPAFLFESVVGGEQVSRFSFVGFSLENYFRGYKETIISEPRQEDKSIPTPEDPLVLVKRFCP